MPRFLLAILLLLPLSCGDPSGPGDQAVVARLHGAGMSVLNRSGDAIHYFAVERETAALVDWIPCTNPFECPRIDAGRSVAIAADRIIGLTPEADEVLFYWWRLVPVGDAGFVPDSIRSLVVSR